MCRKLDIFGVKLRFRVANHSTFQTVFSSLFTVFFGISLFIFTYFFGLDFFLQKNPKTFSSNGREGENSTLTFNNEVYFTAWRIEDFEGREINFTNILFPQIYYYNSSSKSHEKVHYKKCKDFNFSFPLNDEIKEYYCIDWKNRKVGGSWSKTYLYYFYFGLYFCEEEDDPLEAREARKRCSSKTIIDSTIKKSNSWYISFYYPTVSFLPEKKGNPFQLSYFKHYHMLTPNLVKNERTMIQKYIVNDDKNFLFESSNNKTIYAVSKFESDFYNLDLDEVTANPYRTAFYYMHWYIDEQNVYYKRWYPKITESLAVVGTYAKVSHAILLVISDLINFFVLYTRLSFFCFEFPTSPMQEHTRSLKKKIGSNTSLTKIVNLNATKLVRSQTITRDDFNFRTKFSFSMWKKNQVFFRKAKKNLNKRLDILFYLRKINEDYSIRKILLQNYQYVQLNETNKEKLDKNVEIEKNKSSNEVLRSINMKSFDCESMNFFTLNHEENSNILKLGNGKK